MLNLIREIRALVAEANRLAAVDPGDAPRWSVFLTNRSFLAAALAVVLNIATLAGVPLAAWLHGIAPGVLADQIVQFASAALLIYSALERLWGKTRAVWSVKQARKAVEEAAALTAVAAQGVKPDDLAAALTAAGAPAVQS